MNRNKYVLLFILSVAKLALFYSQEGKPFLPSLYFGMGHSTTKEISAVAFSPSGKYFATGASDFSIKLWHTGSRKELRTFIGHGNNINCLIFSSDEKYLFSCSDDTRVFRWNILTGKKETDYGHFGYKAHELKSPVMAISPNEDLIAVGDQVGKITLFAYKTGKQILQYDAHLDSVTGLLFSRDSKHIISCSSDSMIGIWDVITGSEIKKIRNGAQPVTDISISPNGKNIVSSSKDGSVVVWNLENYEEVICIPNATQVDSVKYSSRGDYIFSTCENKIYKWKTSDYSLETIYNQNEKKSSVSYNLNGIERSPAMVITISPDEKMLLGGYQGRFEFWDLDSNKRTIVLGSSSEDAKRFKYIGGKVFFSNCTYCYNFLDAKIEACERPAWELSQSRTTSENEIYSASVQNNKSNIIDIVDKQNNNNPTSMITNDAKYRTFLFTKDGKYLITGDDDKIIKIWEAQSGKLLRVFPKLEGKINALAVSADDKYLISNDDGDRNLIVWDFNLCTQIRSTQRDSYAFYSSIDIAADNTTIATGDFYGNIDLWNFETMTRNKILTGHDNNITQVSLIDDNKHLLSIDSKNYFRFWNISDGTCVIYYGNKDKWLIISDDGFWDGSTNCGDLVSMVHEMDVWNIDQFATRNNRPDIILKRSGSKDQYLVNHYYMQYLKRLKHLGLSEKDLTTDFRVPITSIVKASQKDKYVNLELSFSSNGKKLASYQIYANDVPLFGSTGKHINGSSINISEKIELTNGNNKIEVSCMDTGGVESYRVPQSFNWKDDTTNNLYFLAFGVSVYQDTAIRRLHYPAKDARDLENALKSMEGKGFRKVFTRTYIDAQVTKSSISQAKGFLKDAHPDDTFVLFISGHGVQVGGKATRPVAENGKGISVVGVDSNLISESTYYYVTADAKLSDITHTAADFETIEDLLQGIAPRQKLFLIDTCESGENDEQSPRLAVSLSGAKGLFARTLSPESTRGLAVLPKVVSQATTEKDRYIYNDLARRSGAIVFSSCQGNEASLEADVWQQGAFTAKILAAFRDPAADLNRDGKITTDELRAYVMAEVPKLVKSLDPSAEQHPTVDRDNIYAKFGFPITK